MKYYSGIGAVETPIYIQNLFCKLGLVMAKYGYTLRSGHADGADMAFETGCDKVNGKKEIYLPWKNFNGSNSNLIGVTNEAYEVLSKYRPSYRYYKRTSKLLLGRDVYQVLGLTLNEPSNCVICWTPNGDCVGGSSIVLSIAKDYNIPTFNRGSYPDDNTFISDLKNFVVNNNPYK